VSEWSQEAAAKVSRRLHYKPRTPTQLAADVVEQVLRTEGDPYLQTQEHSLTWWQLSLLDVKLFLALGIVLILVMAGAATWALVVMMQYVWKGPARGLYGGRGQSKSKSS